MRDTWPLLEKSAFPPLARGRLDTLQVNVGYRCNQSCVHCHVGASPQRTEEMAGETVDLALEGLERRRTSPPPTPPAAPRSSTGISAGWWAPPATSGCGSWTAAISPSWKLTVRRTLR